MVLALWMIQRNGQPSTHRLVPCNMVQAYDLNLRWKEKRKQTMEAKEAELLFRLKDGSQNLD